jgi:hypothetical protein
VLSEALESVDRRAGASDGAKSFVLGFSSAMVWRVEKDWLPQYLLCGIIICFGV